MTSRSAGVSSPSFSQPLEELGRGAAAQLELLPVCVSKRERLLVAVLRAAVVDDDVGAPPREGERPRAAAEDDDEDSGADERSCGETESWCPGISDGRGRS